MNLIKGLVLFSLPYLRVKGRAELLIGHRRLVAIKSKLWWVKRLGKDFPLINTE